MANGRVTRFYDRQADKDGPVSGALFPIHVFVESQTGAQTVTRTIQPPAGMKLEITHGWFTASATGATPELDITGAATIVDTTTCTTDLGALTIASGECNNTSPLVISFTTTASDTITQGNLTLVGYVSAAPTTLLP